MATQDAPATERVELLRLLYPWYKEEVYRRRQQMIWLTVSASTVCLSLLFLITALPPPRPAHRAWFVLAGAAVLLFSVSMIYCILQQHVRHRMAKQILIAIERGLGLYEQGRYADDLLYPADWQRAWLQDRSVTIYLTVVALLTLLVLLALVLR